MIVITGAAGFIGSCLVGKLNRSGQTDILIVDDFHAKEKRNNFRKKMYSKKIDRADFLQQFFKHAKQIKYVIHVGARTDTSESNLDLLAKLNTVYSKEIWNLCTLHQIPLIYASSAATYGGGEYGYSDDHAIIEKLKPLNPYGVSKNEFDKWVIQQTRKDNKLNAPPFWAGLKFFNVYGPNEQHKGRMASVVLHAYQQLNDTGKIQLFRSHRNDFDDGEQLRDFIYVKDVVDVIAWIMHTKMQSGIYNLGTGKARTFYDLAKATAQAMDAPLEIEWIDIPQDIRTNYQYFTEANMRKLRKAGYNKEFYSLELGIEDYVQNYLMEEVYN